MLSSPSSQNTRTDAVNAAVSACTLLIVNLTFMPEQLIAECHVIVSASSPIARITEAELRSASGAINMG